MSLRESTWIFDGCSSGGLSLGIVAATIGDLDFTEPSGKKVRFSYIGGGVGVGVGVKVAKFLPKISGSVAPSIYPSIGKLYMLPGFNEKELSIGDLTGLCLFIDGGLNPGLGVSGSVMLLGYDYRIVGKYKALASLGYENSGLSIGAACYVGSLEVSKLSLLNPTGLWEVRANGEIFYYRFNKSNTVQWSYDKQLSTVKGEGKWQMMSYALRIDWNSGSYEKWNVPLYSKEQSGIWYTKGAKEVESMAFQGIKGQSYKISARRLDITGKSRTFNKSSTLCDDEAMATCD